MFTEGWLLDLKFLLKLKVWAGIWKFGASFTKIGGGEGFKLGIKFCRLSLCWRSHSSGQGLAKSLNVENDGIDPRSFLLLSFGPGGQGGNKSEPSLLLLLLLLLSLLFLLLYHFMPSNLSSFFCISNLFPGRLGKDLIKSLSICFLFKSISLSKDSTIGFSASNVDSSSKTTWRGFFLLKIFLLMGSNFCLILASLFLLLSCSGLCWSGYSLWSLM